MGGQARVWKWVGLAGVAGVAATGVVVARDQRRRSQLQPDQVRARLHERLAEAGPVADVAPSAVPARARRWGRRSSRR